MIKITIVNSPLSMAVIPPLLLAIPSSVAINTFLVIPSSTVAIPSSLTSSSWVFTIIPLVVSSLVTPIQ